MTDSLTTESPEQRSMSGNEEHMSERRDVGQSAEVGGEQFSGRAAESVQGRNSDDELGPTKETASPQGVSDATSGALSPGSLDELMARWDTTLVAEARADIIESRREDLETTGDALRAALGSLIQERDQLSKENARLAIRVIEREHEVMDEAVQAVNWHKKADAAEAHCRLLEQERDEARRRVEHYRDHDYQLYDKMIHDLTGEHAAKPVLPWETSVPDNVAAHKEGK